LGSLFLLQPSWDSKAIPWFQQRINLYDAQQIQKHEDDHKDEQYVNDVARTRETGEDIRSKIAEQPKDKQNYDDPSKHEISPFI